MPRTFTRDEAAAIAALASLDLDPAELDLFARQLGDILAYADEVQRADTTGVPPTASIVAETAGDREDRVCASLDRARALDGAPEPALTSGFFKVPRVIG
jgi:aspartyl-tRNA(Asn)/glutamyl-tRNA(Gln) amidotransferase subunit C